MGGHLHMCGIHTERHRHNFFEMKVPLLKDNASHKNTYDYTTVNTKVRVSYGEFKPLSL